MAQSPQSAEFSSLDTHKPLPSLPQDDLVERILFGHSKKHQMLRRALLVAIAVVLLFSSYAFLSDRVIAAQTITNGIRLSPHPHPDSHPTTVPQHFQTSPELWPGPTATGRAPFLAATNPVSFAASGTFAPNEPLETALPIVGMEGGNQSIFRSMGHLSPYFPNPDGFGVREAPLPEGARIAQVQMLSRHGSRYPTSESNVQAFADRLAAAAGKFTASGALSFLNDWKYELGAEILVPKGRQELFDSGVLHYYQYAGLYNPNSKIIARTTTQDRMLKSAEYFMAGFFGLEWTRNATLELIIEVNGFNNSLAGYKNCPNSSNWRNSGGQNATLEWVDIYLKGATQRFQASIKGFDWTVADTFAAQTLCPYETVAFGYSAFCSLFTYSEWESFEYAQDLSFAGSSAFQSPTGRAVGIGYVQETVARLKNHTLGYSGSQINTTLDSSLETFPLNQSLYFDFSHDTNIMSILTAFGFTQFSEFLDPTRMDPNRKLKVSHLEPFAARLDLEIIKTPHPVHPTTRAYIRNNNNDKNKDKESTYVHFLLNQRTLAHPECEDRVDGWCKLGEFLAKMESKTQEARFEKSCFGNWEGRKYGGFTDGTPGPD